MKFTTGLALVNAAAALEIQVQALPPSDASEEKRIFGLYLDAMDGEIDDKFRSEDLYALLGEAAKPAGALAHFNSTSVSHSFGLVIGSLKQLPVNQWNLQDVLDQVDKAWWEYTDSRCNTLTYLGLPHCEKVKDWLANFVYK